MRNTMRLKSLREMTSEVVVSNVVSGNSLLGCDDSENRHAVVWAVTSNLPKQAALVEYRLFEGADAGATGRLGRQHRAMFTALRVSSRFASGSGQIMMVNPREALLRHVVVGYNQQSRYGRRDGASDWTAVSRHRSSQAQELL